MRERKYVVPERGRLLLPFCSRATVSLSLLVSCLPLTFAISTVFVIIIMILLPSASGQGFRL